MPASFSDGTALGARLRELRAGWLKGRGWSSRRYALAVWRSLGVWSAVGLGVFLAVGCNSSETFNCQDDAGCGNDGECEANGFCSFPDAECESGRRYGDLAGAGLQGQCVAPSEGSTGAPAGTTGDASGTIGCPLGTLGCVCTDGICDAGLDCIANVCVPSADATFSTSSGVGESGFASSTGGFGTTADASTGDETTGFASTGSTETGGGGVCNMEGVPCSQCFSCVGRTECAEQSITCEGIPGCTIAAECLQQCVAEGLCFRDCCDGQSETVQEAALALNSCRQDACIGDSCAVYAPLPDGCGN